MFRCYYKTADKTRFTFISEFSSADDAIEFIKTKIGPNSSTAFHVRSGSNVVWEYSPSNAPKAVERLIGDNLAMVHFKVDRFHVSASVLSIARELKATIKNWRAVPRSLRRGLVQAIIERHTENRSLYCRVMSGRI